MPKSYRCVSTRLALEHETLLLMTVMTTNTTYSSTLTVRIVQDKNIKTLILYNDGYDKCNNLHCRVTDIFKKK